MCLELFSFLPLLEIELFGCYSLQSGAYSVAVYNQRRILHSGGIDILVNILHRSVNRLDQAHHGQLAICIVKTLDAILTDNGNLQKELYFSQIACK